MALCCHFPSDKSDLRDQQWNLRELQPAYLESFEPHAFRFSCMNAFHISHNLERESNDNLKQMLAYLLPHV